MAGLLLGAMDQACSVSAPPQALAGAQVWLCIMKPILGDRITHPFRRTFIIGFPPCAPGVLCDCICEQWGCAHGTPGAEVSIRKAQGAPSATRARQPWLRLCPWASLCEEREGWLGPPRSETPVGGCVLGTAATPWFPGFLRRGTGAVRSPTPARMLIVPPVQGNVPVSMRVHALGPQA